MKIAPATERRFRFTIVLGLILSIIGVVPPAAHAATTALDTGTSSYDNFNLASGAYFAFALNADAAFTVESIGFLIGVGKTSSDVNGSTVSLYSGHPSSPTNPSNLLGSLSFSTIVSEASRLRVTYTGSISVPSAGRYWWKIGNLAAGKDIWVRMGGFAGHTGTWTAWNGTANWDLNGTISNSVGSYPKVLITGTAGGGGGSSTPAPDTERRESQRKLQVEIDSCRANLKSALISNQEIAVGTFSKCGYRSLSESSEYSAVRELLLLPVDTRTSDVTLNKVVKKVGTYEDIQGSKSNTVTVKQLVETGIIDASVPNKTVILLGLWNLELVEKDTIPEVDAFIALESKKMLDRKARLAATISRIQSR